MSASDTAHDDPWQLFKGNGQSSALTPETVPEAPGWRLFMPDEQFDQVMQQESNRRLGRVQGLADQDTRGKERGESFRIDERYKGILNAVNAALRLRRPLLVTGTPGSGKTSLAYAVAYELKLGKVLSWPVTARSKLEDALYRYDAVARLQDAQLKRERPIGDYIRLGPVGTAFLPSQLPRVLLIDEIDKCDINLPNDLLNLFEEGQYEIPELVRRKEEYEIVDVQTADRDVSAQIRGGRVMCREFPFVVMTSNGERDFPPAFLRRCLRLEMPNPTYDSGALERIVEAHLRRDVDDKRWPRIQDEITAILNKFLEKKSPDEAADIATDQLLNVVYLLTRKIKPSNDERDQLEEILLRGLSEED